MKGKGRAQLLGEGHPAGKVSHVFDSEAVPLVNDRRTVACRCLYKNTYSLLPLQTLSETRR